MNRTTGQIVRGKIHEYMHSFINNILLRIAMLHMQIIVDNRIAALQYAVVINVKDT